MRGAAHPLYPHMMLCSPCSFMQSRHKSCAADLDNNCRIQLRKAQRCSATTPCALRICKSLSKDNISGRPEAYLGHPRHRALPVVSAARQAASCNGVADGQVAWAAVLVIVAAGGRLRINSYSSGQWHYCYKSIQDKMRRGIHYLLHTATIAGGALDRTIKHADRSHRAEAPKDKNSTATARGTQASSGKAALGAMPSLRRSCSCA